MKIATVHSNADTRSAFWDPDLTESEADSLAEAGVQRFHRILRALFERRWPLAALDIRWDPTVSGVRHASEFKVWFEDGELIVDEAATEQLLELEQAAFQAAVEGATTLEDLMREAGAFTYVLADRGDGMAWGDAGTSVTLTEDDDGWDAEVVGTVMYRLPEPHVSLDGVPCHWGSEWMVLGTTENPYSVRVLF